MRSDRTPRLRAIMPRQPTDAGDAATHRRLTSLGVALLLMIIVVGCSAPEPPGQSETDRELSWSRIALPESVAASSLAPAAKTLLVGGRATSEGDQPVLFVVEASGSTRSVPLHPNSPYAKVADLVSVAVDGDEVVAIGAAHGGAHANFRWTVWAGFTQRLDEYPQTFETFGGKSAGGLLDIVSTGRAGNRRHLGFTGRRPRHSGMAASRRALDPAGFCWDGACQHTADPRWPPRSDRCRAGHDHLGLIDHFWRRRRATSGRLDSAEPYKSLDIAAASRRRYA
jgi:hypothetical protein